MWMLYLEVSHSETIHHNIKCHVKRPFSNFLVVIARDHPDTI